MVSFEHENEQAYRLLLRIEIAMRECLKIAFESKYGVGWRKNLPGELLKKVKDSQREEARPQFNFLRLGPLYYLTFGELLTLLRQKPAQELIQKLGGEAFLKQLENILPPRNAVGHSRPVGSVGLKTIETLYAQLETALCASELTRLLARPDTGITQHEVADGLIQAFEVIVCLLPGIPDFVEIPDIYETAVIQYWWANDVLAGFERNTVDRAVSLLKIYNALPTGVGSAGRRLHFCEDNSLAERVQQAVIELRKVTL
ncbi:MAG: hypothetical protein AMXMBFR84_49630 [Candidatus Hydrogenedentota bacterium]